MLLSLQQEVLRLHVFCNHRLPGAACMVARERTMVAVRVSGSSSVLFHCAAALPNASR
jgi:hypothetical protein